MSSWLHRISASLALLAWFGGMSFSAAAAELRVGETLNLISRAQVFDGTEANLPPAIDAVRTAAGPMALPHEMYSERWFILAVSSPADSQNRDWVLRMATDPLYLPVFAVLKDGVVESVRRRDDAVAIGVTSGATLGLGQRFGLIVPPGETRTVVLRVASIGFASLVADIVDLPGYITWATTHHAIVLFALAVILAIGLYNLSLGLALRRSSHIWYALHALSGFVTWASVFGIFADLFGYTDHDRIVYKLSIIGVALFAPLFVRAIFAADRMPKILDRVLLAIVGIELVFLALTVLLWPFPELHRAWVRGPEYSYLVGIFSNLVMIWAGLWAVRRRIAGAVWFLVGWGFYVGTTSYAILGTFGLFEFTSETLMMVLLGATWETLLLSQALGARLRALDRERDAANNRREALQTFIASISHDLRAPVLSIIATIGAARTQTSNAGMHRLLDMISRASATMLGLLSDLLDRQRLATARFEINAVPFDLAGLVDDCIGMLRYRAEEKGMTLDYDFDSAIEHGAIGDPVRLKQILTNLLDNAVKFTDSGTVRLTVTSSSGEDTRHIRFTVADTGPGIQPGQRDQIFDPFYKADPETPGIGLGLAIARHLAVLMGGNLVLQENAPQGTCFTLDIPLPVTTLGVSGRRYTIWLVDDDADQRDTWAQLLNREIIGVEAVLPPAAAERPPLGQIDAVLMDLSIEPDLMAMIIRTLRRSPTAAQVPIIAFSADSTRWTSQFSAMGILPSPGKSMSPAEIAAVIRTAASATPLIDYSRQFELLDELGAEGLLRVLGKFLLLADQLFAGHARAPGGDLLHRLSGSAALLGFPVLAREALHYEKRIDGGETPDLGPLRKLLDDSIAQSSPARLAQAEMMKQPI